jgi:hypothetical protein
VTGGCQNIAGPGQTYSFACTTGGDETVTGGNTNWARAGVASAITGGIFNSASGLDSAVTGGYQNTASGDYSSISGGSINTATGLRSSILGGYQNTLDTSCGTIPAGAGVTC